jgi:hypothetical protein
MIVNKIQKLTTHTHTHTHTHTQKPSVAFSLQEKYSD